MQRGCIILFDIRTKRKEANLTQDELAKKIGINRATLSKYENGQIEPPFSQLVKISDALDVSIFEFFPDRHDELSRFIYFEGFQESQDELRECGYTFSDEESKLIEGFSMLNAEGQKVAVDRINELKEIPKYQRTETQESFSGGGEYRDTTTKEKPPEGIKTPNDGK